MSREIRQYTAVIPANTPIAAPVFTDMSFPPRQVDTVEIIVPPGPSGLIGFAIQNSGVTVIPYGSDQWIITANEKIAWPLDGYINSGSWGLLGYNTGSQAHAVYVRFLLSLPDNGRGSVATPIPTSLINSDTAAPFVAIATI